MAASASDIVNAYRIPGALARKIVSVSEALGFPDPAMLANVINFESNNFDPQAVNALSGATGLIQFMPRTAGELGTTTAALRSMSAVEQMDYVQRYFQLPRIRKHGPLRTQTDVYMAVFYPDAIGKGDGYRFSPQVQAMNPGITTAGSYARYANARARLVPAMRTAAVVATVGSIAVAGICLALLWRYRDDLRDLL